MALLLATALLFPVLSLFLFLLYFRRSAAGRARLLPPGPKPWPLVGSLPSVLLNRPAFRWVLRVTDGKPISCIRLGGTHVIVVNTPELAGEFLRKHDATFSSRPVTMASEYSSRGFRTVAVNPMGLQWKKMRRVLASEVLSMRMFRWQLDLRREELDHILRYVRHCCAKAGGKAVVDVRLVTRCYTGNVVRRMLFGRRHFGEEGEGGAPSEAEMEHVDAAFDMLSVLYSFALSDYFPWTRWLDLEGHERIARRAMGAINGYHDAIIEERVHGWRYSFDESRRVHREPEDLLDVMISIKDSDGKALLSVDEIKAQAGELVLATVDNASNIVEWAIGEMLKESKILAKAVEELDRVVGRDRLVQESDLPELPYIKACAREALRLHPVAPFNLPHVSSEDATVAGYFIPRGSHVLIGRVGLGRNPAVWEDPLRFDPERHLAGAELAAGEVELAEPALRFVSFAVGRRSCMGSLLGSAMAYMLLARLLQCFEWGAPPGLGVDLSEGDNSFYMASPLHATAQSRLPALLEKL